MKAQSQQAISNIAGIGFSSAESRCTCIEVPEDRRGECREFNLRLAEEAQGKLAGLAILKYASIVGSHANHACKSV